MPIIASAKKALRQNITNKTRNDFFRETYREKRVAFEKAIKENDLKAAKEVFASKKDKDGKTISSWLQSVVDKLVKKNIIHKNNWARKKAKFVRMMKSIDTKATAKKEVTKKTTTTKTTTAKKTTAKKAPAKKTATKSTKK